MVRGIRYELKYPDIPSKLDVNTFIRHGVDQAASCVFALLARYFKHSAEYLIYRTYLNFKNSRKSDHILGWWLTSLTLYFLGLNKTPPPPPPPLLRIRHYTLYNYILLISSDYIFVKNEDLKLLCSGVFNATFPETYIPLYKMYYLSSIVVTQIYIPLYTQVKNVSIVYFGKISCTRLTNIWEPNS